MAGLLSRQVFQKLYTISWRALCTTEDQPYWISKFPDGQPRPFKEMPLIPEENFEIRKFHEVSMQWFLKYGHVSRQIMPDDSAIVHLYHFEDFSAVYKSDGLFPTRRSHRVMRRYREDRPDLYENVGLGAGEGEEWRSFRSMLEAGITEKMIRILHPRLEEVANDLVSLLRLKSKEGPIDMLPWLFRWAFESTGILALNKRLGALSESGSDEADKMVEAAGLTNEMISLSEVDWVRFDSYLQRLIPAQDYFYNVIIGYVDEITSSQETKGVVKHLLQQEKYTKKNIVTLTMDLFQGALQTVPLTVLMALFNLAKNKHVQDAVRGKLEKLLPEEESKYYAATRRFNDTTPHYLSSIVWETLRLTPPIIGNGRVLQEDLVLGGYEVPKGTNCILHNQVAYVLEENFEEPLKFKPERHPTPHQMHLEFSFGGSSRICLGRRFALGQMAMVIAKIMKEFEISPHGEEPTIINRLHNEPEQPLFLKLHPLA